MKDQTFGLSDFQPATPRRTAAGAAAFLGIALIWLISAATTGAFFGTFAPSAGALVGPTYQAPAAAIMGILLLDVMALLWPIMAARAASSVPQITTAITAAIADIVLSIGCSATYIALTSRFEIAADLRQRLDTAGALIVVAAVAVNFLAAFVWTVTSADMRAALAATQIASMAADGRTAADRARAQRVITETLSQIDDALPAAAASAGIGNRDRYLAAAGLPKAAAPLPADEDNAMHLNGHAAGR